MNNWTIDYHHALLIRLMSMALLVCALFAIRLFAGHLWQVGSSLFRRLRQGTPKWRHQKP
jgi:hypothetical protein